MAFRKDVPMQRKTLFISAGHSNTDPGAVGNGLTEADVVLEFRDLLGQYLQEKGIVFSQDGEKGNNLPLRQAVGMAATADIAVEFHCNAFSKASANGVETLSKPELIRLGTEIAEAVNRVSAISNRGAKNGASGQHSRLAFLEQGNGMIVELFFLTNKGDVSRYQNSKHKIVKAVGDVLIREVA